MLSVEHGVTCVAVPGFAHTKPKEPKKCTTVTNHHKKVYFYVCEAIQHKFVSHYLEQTNCETLVLLTMLMSKQKNKK